VNNPFDASNTFIASSNFIGASIQIGITFNFLHISKNAFNTNGGMRFGESDSPVIIE
jgi:hypothetical protein